MNLAVLQCIGNGTQGMLLWESSYNIVGALHGSIPCAVSVHMKSSQTFTAPCHATRSKTYCSYRHDHFFGNFRTAAGKIRRIDVIIAPAEEQAFCVLGWTGSRQYLRFLRQHVVDLGMNLNSHR